MIELGKKQGINCCVCEQGWLFGGTEFKFPSFSCVLCRYPQLMRFSGPPLSSIGVMDNI